MATIDLRSTQKIHKPKTDYNRMNSIELRMDSIELRMNSIEQSLNLILQKLNKDNESKDNNG